MKILRDLFKKKSDIYPYEILDYESDGDAAVYITGVEGVDYILDLDWEDGEMDIEFGVKNMETHNTTNLNVQYKLLNTISLITRQIAKRCGMKFHTVVFKSSNWRDGDIDFKSGEIRNRFFSRYVIKYYPNATVESGENNSVIIKLNSL